MNIEDEMNERRFLNKMIKIDKSHCRPSKVCVLPICYALRTPLDLDWFLNNCDMKLVRQAHGKY